jgi:5'-3' exonuclease
MTIADLVLSDFAPDPSKPMAGRPHDPYPWLLIDGGGLATTAWSTHRGLDRAEDRIKATFYVFVTSMASLSRLVSDSARIIVAWDGRDNRAWRRGLHPWYKHGRGTVINREEVRAAIEGLDELIWAMGGACLTVDGREADDVVATLSRVISDEKEEMCLIFSDDKDYVQLVDDRVHLARRSLQGVILSPEQCELMGTPYGLDYLHIKAMMGDPGDNIKGLPGIGEVKAADIAMSIPDAMDVARTDPELIEWDRAKESTVRAFVRAGRKLVWPPAEEDRAFALEVRARRGLEPHPEMEVDEGECLRAAAIEAVRMLDLVQLDDKMDLPKFSFPQVNLERIPKVLRKLGLEREDDLVSSIYTLARMRNPEAIPPRTSAVRAGEAVR